MAPAFPSLCPGSQRQQDSSRNSDNVQMLREQSPALVSDRWPEWE